MTKCSAKGCKNTSNHGVRMNYFPKDAMRRAKWKHNCQVYGEMDNWEPTDTSALCEV